MPREVTFPTYIPCKLFCCCPDKFRNFLNQVFRLVLFSLFCGYVVFTVWAISSSVKFKRKNINNPDHKIFQKFKEYKLNIFPIGNINLRIYQYFSNPLRIPILKSLLNPWHVSWHNRGEILKGPKKIERAWERIEKPYINVPLCYLFFLN